MAAQLVTKINRYIGTAAEIAAMTLTGIPTGSTFFESDTGILKVLNAAGALVTAPSETVQLSGSKVAEMQDQSDATEDVLTFTANISAIEIYHSEATPQSFTVNGLTLIVAAGGWRSPIAGTPGATVGIPTGVNCIVARLV